MSQTEQYLEGAFGKAASAHYFWQTEHPYVGAREKDLVERAFLPLKGRVLDVGCAEGATLFHLGEPAGAVGVDLFEEKLAFARARLPRCTFVNASCYALPFADASFDHLLVRDVIHHLDRPERAMEEMRRVLAPGGRLDILEPCGRNPLIAMHALMNRAERGELRSTEGHLERLLEGHFVLVETRRYQAMPVHRVVFHPELGRAAWGESDVVTRAVSLVEKAAEAILPRAAWAYVHVRARL